MNAEDCRPFYARARGRERDDEEGVDFFLLRTHSRLAAVKSNKKRAEQVVAVHRPVMTSLPPFLPWHFSPRKKFIVHKISRVDELALAVPSLTESFVVERRKLATLDCFTLHKKEAFCR